MFECCATIICQQKLKYSGLGGRHKTKTAAIYMAAAILFMPQTSEYFMVPTCYLWLDMCAFPHFTHCLGYFVCPPSECRVHGGTDAGRATSPAETGASVSHLSPLISALCEKFDLIVLPPIQTLK